VATLHAVANQILLTLVVQNLLSRKHASKSVKRAHNYNNAPGGGQQTVAVTLWVR